MSDGTRTKVLAPTIIPAHPGFFEVTYEAGHGDLGEELFLEPIIGWAVQPTVEEPVPNRAGQELVALTTYPVTPSTQFVTYAKDLPQCILTPQGHYIFEEDRTITSKDKALAYFRELNATPRRSKAAV